MKKALLSILALALPLISFAEEAKIKVMVKVWTRTGANPAQLSELIDRIEAERKINVLQLTKKDREFFIGLPESTEDLDELIRTLKFELGQEFNILVMPIKDMSLGVQGIGSEK